MAQYIILSDSRMVQVPEGASPDKFRKVQEAAITLATCPKKCQPTRRNGKPRKSINYAVGVLYRRNAFDDVIPFAEVVS